MSLEMLIDPDLQEVSDVEFDQIVLKIRDTINGVPPERYAEIFSEFSEAARKRDIKMLADAVANWAVRLPRKKMRGEIVNHTLDDLPPLSDDPEVYESIQEFKALMRESEA